MWIWLTGRKKYCFYTEVAYAAGREILPLYLARPYIGFCFFPQRSNTAHSGLVGGSLMLHTYIS